jgi:hypothetical protein
VAERNDVGTADGSQPPIADPAGKGGDAWSKLRPSTSRWRCSIHSISRLVRCKTLWEGPLEARTGVWKRLPH